jgi:dTMP kinase
MKMYTSIKPNFISFEGIDGCGKSTQVKLLMKKLLDKKVKAILVREPGGSSIAESIRSILLDNKNNNMSSQTEALLMTASRAQLTREVIIPKLKSGYIVVADRFQDSTIAYQGGGRGLDVSFLKKINLFATEKIVPDLTFYIDLKEEEGFKRVNKKEFDRIENAGRVFQSNVRLEYLRLAEEEPKRVILINGNNSIENIHSIIWKNITK